jgi:uncharacterized sulfatase
MSQASQDGVPWVLVVSYDEPHHPYVCPPEFLANYEDAELPTPETYDTGFDGKPLVQAEWSEWLNLSESDLAYHQRLTFAATEFVDSEIGRVLEAVQGLDDTYVLFTSDHGNQLGAHGLMWKGPWMYEESIRVPLLVRGPGLAEGTTVSEVVSHLDILPTLMDIAGIPIPPIMDSRPMTGLLRGVQDANGEGRQAHIEFNRFQLDRDDFGAFYPIRCIVDGTMKLVINLFDIDELYDLETDPLERVNLIDNPAYAVIRDRLHAELLDRMYVRRDAFRSPDWERRPWSDSRRFARCRGRIRTTPATGIGLEARGYMTGQPIEYDFRL